MSDITLSLTLKDDGTLVFDKFSQTVLSSLKSIETSTDKTSERFKGLTEQLQGVSTAADRINSPFTKLGYTLQSVHAGFELVKTVGEGVFKVFEITHKAVETLERSLFDLGKRVVFNTENFEKFALVLSSTVGSSRGGLLAQITKDISDVSPLLEVQVRQIVQSLSLIPQIQLKLQSLPMAQVRQELEKSVNAIQALAVFRPDQGAMGALYAYREFLQGDLRSFTARFDVNIESILPALHSSTQKLKSSLNERKRVIEEFATTIMSPDTMKKLSMTPTLLVQGLQEQIDNFLIRIGKSGFYDKIYNYLNSFYETFKGALTASDGPFANLAQSLSDFLGKILDEKISRYSRVSDKFLNVFVPADQRGLPILDKVGIVLEKILHGTEVVLRSIDEIVEGIFDTISKALEGLSSKDVADFITKTYNVIKDIATVTKDIIVQILHFLPTLTDFIKNHPILSVAGGAGAMATIGGVSGLATGALMGAGAMAGAALKGIGSNVVAASALSAEGSIIASLSAGGIVTIVSSVLAALGVGFGAFQLGKLLNKWFASDDSLKQETLYEETLSKIRGGDVELARKQVEALERLEKMLDYTSIQERFGMVAGGDRVQEVYREGTRSRYELYEQGFTMDELSRSENVQFHLKQARQRLQESEDANIQQMLDELGKEKDAQIEEWQNQIRELEQKNLEEAANRVRFKSELDKFAQSRFNLIDTGLNVGSNTRLTRGASMGVAGGTKELYARSLEQTLLGIFNAREGALQDLENSLTGTEEAPVVTVPSEFRVPPDVLNEIGKAGRSRIDAILFQTVEQSLQSIFSDIHGSGSPQENAAIVSARQKTLEIIEKNKDLVGLGRDDILRFAELDRLQKDITTTAEERATLLYESTKLQIDINKKIIDGLLRSRDALLESEFISPSDQIIVDLEGKINSAVRHTAELEGRIPKITNDLVQAYSAVIGTYLSAITELSKVGSVQYPADIEGIRSRFNSSLNFLQTRDSSLTQQRGQISSYSGDFEKISQRSLGLHRFQTELRYSGDSDERNSVKIASEELDIYQRTYDLTSKLVDSSKAYINERLKTQDLNPQQEASLKKQLEEHDRILESIKRTVEQKKEQVELSKKDLAILTNYRDALNQGFKDASREIATDNPFRDLAKNSTISFRDALSNSIVDGVRKGGDGATAIFKNFLGTLSDMLLDAAAKNLANAAIQGLLSAVGSIAPAIGGWIGSSGTTGSGTWTSGNYQWKAAEGGILPGPFIPFKAFSSGGLVKRPTMGLVGEGGQNEAIVPLPNGSAIPVQFVGSNSKSQPTEINQTIINTVDKDFIRATIVEGGGDLVVNMIGQNSGKIRRILGII